MRPCLQRPCPQRIRDTSGPNTCAGQSTLPWPVSAMPENLGSASILRKRPVPRQTLSSRCIFRRARRLAPGLWPHFSDEGIKAHKSDVTRAASHHGHQAEPFDSRAGIFTPGLRGGWRWIVAPRAQVSNCHFLSPFHPGNRLRPLAPTHPGPPEAPRFALKAAHGRSQKEVSPLPPSQLRFSFFIFLGGFFLYFSL